MHSCREGSGWMRILDRVAKRKATYSDVDLLADVTKQIEGHTICAFERVLLGQCKVC